MDCRTARTLLPYTALPGELGDDERAEFDAHVVGCSSCTAAAGAERSFDEAIGRAIRAVPVPPGLRGDIATRLAVDRGHVWRRQMVRATAAAAALLVVTLGLGWWASQKSEVSSADLARQMDDELQFVVNGRPDGVEEYFRSQGMKVKLPPDFDPALLTNVDFVEFHGHRAARLDYQHNEFRARVYVLSKRQYKVKKGGGSAVPGSNCSVEIVELGDLIYVIVYQFDAKRDNFLNRNQQVG
jgi:hypothetical protein